MVVGQYDVRLNGDRMPILIQMNTFSFQEEVTITSPDVLVKVLNQFFFLECKAEEYVHMLAVNSAMKPIGFFEISHGSVNASLLCSREVFLRLLLCGASGMILVHNHPSGSVAIDKGNPQSSHFWKKNGFEVISEADVNGWTKLVAERQLK